MTDTMMVLGDFVFSLPTMVYQDLSRRTDWSYGRNTRQGARKALQFLGPGDDKITLAGYLVPQVAGAASSFATLRSLADQGDALPLVAGDGTVIGAFLIISLDERQGHINRDGSARRFDFSIELEAVDADDALDPRAKASAFDETQEVDDAEREFVETELAIGIG